MLELGAAYRHPKTGQLFLAVAEGRLLDRAGRLIPAGRLRLEARRDLPLKELLAAWRISAAELDLRVQGWFAPSVEGRVDESIRNLTARRSA